MFNPFKKQPPDAPEEHRITLPGIDIAFNYATRTAYMVDQAGSSPEAMKDIELWFKDLGWYLHWIAVAPPKEPEKSKLPPELEKEIAKATHGQ